MNLKLTSVLSSIGRMSKAPAVRFIKSGNLSGFTALSGKTSKGVNWTKLYNAEGELVSWKSSLMVKLEKVDMKKLIHLTGIKVYQQRLQAIKKLQP